jgi:hypothetical protein
LSQAPFGNTLALATPKVCDESAALGSGDGSRQHSSEPEGTGRVAKRPPAKAGDDVGERGFLKLLERKVYEEEKPL